MRRVKGFTLIEVVVVMVIVALLSIISVPLYKGHVRKARFAEGYTLANRLLKEEKLFYKIRI